MLSLQLIPFAQVEEMGGIARRDMQEWKDNVRV